MSVCSVFLVCLLQFLLSSFRWHFVLCVFLTKHSFSDSFWLRRTFHPAHQNTIECNILWITFQTEQFSSFLLVKFPFSFLVSLHLPLTRAFPFSVWYFVLVCYLFCALFLLQWYFCVWCRYLCSSDVFTAGGLCFCCCCEKNAVGISLTKRCSEIYDVYAWDALLAAGYIHECRLLTQQNNKNFSSNSSIFCSLNDFSHKNHLSTFRLLAQWLAIF